MRIINAIWLFYKKLIISSLSFSIIIALLGGFLLETGLLLKGIGLAYIFIAPLFHFFIYELRNENEYYFYYNLGLSKIVLWISTVLISLSIGLILMLL
jgi:hypothetical protein